MTAKNVDALAALLVQRAGEQHGIHEAAAGRARDLARWLAARGVLVPSALSPEQMAVVGREVEREMAGSGAADPEAHAACVSLLERLARGEPA